MAEWQRTHTCGELRESHVGKSATLNGWVHTYRDHGQFVFIDLRDRYGLTQVVFEPSQGAELFTKSQELRGEWCISVAGDVTPRLAGKENKELPTGLVEVKVKSLKILNECPTPPFEITEFPGDVLANEDLRLQNRFLDLRRQSIQRVLILRHRMNKAIRDYLDERGFLELETPLLGRSTPEGARDYLVPSRVFNGEWYALPQSPQLYKQLLMVAGYDKYFQIARCLRDEDLRADRQPEFTQLDLEMSFVEQNDILGMIEGLTVDVFRRCLGLEVQLPIRRLTYAEAMLRYGSDKPDLRYGMEIIDVGDVVEKSEFKVFRDTITNGGKVRGLCVKGAATKFSNSDLKEKGALPEFAKQFGAKGLAWMKVEADKFTGSIEKFFPAPVQQELRERMGAEAGDLILFIADKEDIVCNALGALRTHLAVQMKLYVNWWERREAEENAHRKQESDRRKKGQPSEPYKFVPRQEEFQLAWLLDFPSFMWDEDEKRWVANHHPFTAPRDEDLQYLESDPGRVLAKAYDLVLNGYEIGGGSIRIHNPEVQSRAFAALGMDAESAQKRFGFLLEALKHGAPPHGGIALGLDRWAMLLGGTTNIRDVIAFPKNQRGRDLMTGAPAAVDKKQLKELGL